MPNLSHIIFRPWFRNLLLIVGGGFLGIGIQQLDIIAHFGDDVIRGADVASAALTLACGLAVVVLGLWRRKAADHPA